MVDNVRWTDDISEITLLKTLVESGEMHLADGHQRMDNKSDRRQSSMEKVSMHHQPFVWRTALVKDDGVS